MDLNEIYSEPNKKMITTNIKSGLISAVIASIIAVGILIISNGSVFNLDYHAVVNTAVITFIASIIKALGTSPQGTFAGVSIK